MVIINVINGSWLENGTKVLAILNYGININEKTII